jgi:precorrin-8X/cobalt-precorrin-8 methylmutase
MMGLRRTPDSIENESLGLIRSAVGAHEFSPEEFQVVERMIQASADLEYAKNTEFRLDALRTGVEAFRQGSSLIVDVGMFASGLRKNLLSKLGVSVRCALHDEGIAEQAVNLETTRSAVAIEKALREKPQAVVAIGNAPTALIRVIELIQEGTVRPALVIGMPVGFVLATESKDMLREANCPSVLCRGRKGGTAVAVSAVNMLLRMAVA